MFYLKEIGAFLHKFFALFAAHPNKWILPFQAIVEDRKTLEDIKNHGNRIHYWFPFILTVLIMTDTLAQYLFYPDNPVFYHHVLMRFMPPIFQRQGDVAVNAVFLLTLLCNGFMLIDPYRHVNFILLYSKGNSRAEMTMPYRDGPFTVLSHRLAEKLIRFQRRSHRPIQALVWCLIFEYYAAYTIPLSIDEFHKIYRSNWEYIPSLRISTSMIVSVLHFPSVVAVLIIGIRFIYQNCVFHIKQGYYFSRMKIVNIEGAKNRETVQRTYRKLFKTMKRMLDFSREIEAFNGLYCIYITFTIIIYGCVGVSKMNAVIKRGSEAPRLVLMPFIFYGVFYLSCLVVFSAVGSRTIFWNVKIFKQLRQFQMKLLSRRFLTRSQTVKLDLVNEYKVFLQKCSFRLLNSTAINDKTFCFIIFGFVSYVYMRIASDKKYN